MMFCHFLIINKLFRAEFIMVWILPIEVTVERPALLTRTLTLTQYLTIYLVSGEVEKSSVDVFQTERLTVMMSSALRHKGRLFMRGSNARNFAMIKRIVILLRSKHQSHIQQVITLILIVIFTSRMDAYQKTINMRELIIMKTKTPTSNGVTIRPDMMTLESGVVFVVRDIIRRFMHAVTLQSQSVDNVLITEEPLNAATTVVRLIGTVSVAIGIRLRILVLRTPFIMPMPFPLLTVTDSVGTLPIIEFRPAGIGKGSLVICLIVTKIMSGVVTCASGRCTNRVRIIVLWSNMVITDTAGTLPLIFRSGIGK